MSKRLITTVAKTSEEPLVKQLQGMPPEFTSGQDSQVELPWPCVLLIKETSEGVYLFRFDENKICGGDTWHVDIDEAKEQATYEYGELLGEWQDVPPTIDDAIDYALQRK